MPNTKCGDWAVGGQSGVWTIMYWGLPRKTQGEMAYVRWVPRAGSQPRHVTSRSHMLHICVHQYAECQVWGFGSKGVIRC